MTPEQFLIDKITALIAIFPILECKHEFDASIQVHWVHILPETLYKKEEFSKQICNIQQEFDDRFIGLELCYIVDNDFILGELQNLQPLVTVEMIKNNQINEPNLIIV